MAVSISKYMEICFYLWIFRVNKYFVIINVCIFIEYTNIHINLHLFFIIFIHSLTLMIYKKIIYIGTFGTMNKHVQEVIVVRIHKEGDVR